MQTKDAGCVASTSVVAASEDRARNSRGLWLLRHAHRCPQHRTLPIKEHGTEAFTTASGTAKGAGRSASACVSPSGGQSRDTRARGCPFRPSEEEPPGNTCACRRLVGEMPVTRPGEGAGVGAGVLQTVMRVGPLGKQRGGPGRTSRSLGPRPSHGRPLARHGPGGACPA